MRGWTSSSSRVAVQKLFRHRRRGVQGVGIAGAGARAAALGCYVTHDSGSYHQAQEQAKADPHRHDHHPADLMPALEAWSYVAVDAGAEGPAFLTMGKRDIPYDAGLPVPIKLLPAGCRLLPVGAATISRPMTSTPMYGLGEGRRGRWATSCVGISHPCTAFDKWRFIPIVDDAYDVIDGVLTFFDQPVAGGLRGGRRRNRARTSAFIPSTPMMVLRVGGGAAKYSR